MAPNLPVLLTLNQVLCWIAFRCARFIRDAPPEIVASVLARDDRTGDVDAVELFGARPEEALAMGKEEAALRCAAARHELRQALIAGALVAWGRRASGYATEASASAVPREQWPFLVIGASDARNAWYADHLREGWRELFVYRDDVLKAFPRRAERLRDHETADPYRTGAPGRPTIMHLVEQELRRMSDADELPPTMGETARILIQWASTAHPDAPTLTEKTVTNKLRTTFRQLRASKCPK